MCKLLIFIEKGKVYSNQAFINKKMDLKVLVVNNDIGQVERPRIVHRKDDKEIETFSELADALEENQPQKPKSDGKSTKLIDGNV